MATKKQKREAGEAKAVIENEKRRRSGLSAQKYGARNVTIRLEELTNEAFHVITTIYDREAFHVITTIYDREEGNVDGDQEAEA